MRVPATIYEINEDAGKIDSIGSASNLTIPAMDGVNHCAGLLQDGLIHKAQYATGRAGTARLMTYRHPNCHFVACWFYIPQIGSSGTYTMTFQAGVGAPTVIFIPAAEHIQWVAIPWGGNGWQEISYTTGDCHVGAICMWSMARDELDPVAAADSAIDRTDPTLLQAGLDEGRFVCDGTADHNVEGLATTVEETHDNLRRQAVNWTGIGAVPIENVAGWRVPAGIPRWQHRSQQWRPAAGVTNQSYRVYARTVSTGNFQWRIRSTVAGSTRTTALLNNAGITWDFLGAFLIDSTADDTLIFEVNVVAGTIVTIYSVCIKQE